MVEVVWRDRVVARGELGDFGVVGREAAGVWGRTRGVFFLDGEGNYVLDEETCASGAVLPAIPLVFRNDR